MSSKHHKVTSYFFTVTKSKNLCQSLINWKNKSIDLKNMSELDESAFLSELEQSPNYCSLPQQKRKSMDIRTRKSKIDALIANLKSGNDLSMIFHTKDSLKYKSIKKVELEIREVESRAALHSDANFVAYKNALASHNMPDTKLAYPFVLMGEGKQLHSWDSELCDKVKLVDNNKYEIWEIRNWTGDTHPIHIHLNRFRILGRHQLDPIKQDEAIGKNVFSLPEQGEKGWKDVVRVPPNTEVYLLVKYVLNPADKDSMGHFVYHCHILEHEDASMMRRLNVKHKNYNDTSIPNGIPICGTPPTNNMVAEKRK